MDKIIRRVCLITTIILFVIVLLVTIIIWATSGVYKKNLGNGYEYCYDYEDIIGPVDIPSRIRSYAYDDNYIVASQNYRDGSPYDLYNTGEYKDVWPGRVDDDHDGIVYWIVNKKTNKNIRCATEYEFVKKCKSIGVSDSLVSHIITGSKPIGIL